MLCGPPPEDYWNKPTLPLAKMSKPRYAYESSLRERCRELSKSAVNLIESFLSIEPEKRGSATSALQSEYFHTKPYACDPASLPKYPPNKEIDAKLREEAHRKKAGGRLRGSGTSRNLRRSRKNLLEQTEVYASREKNGVYLPKERYYQEELERKSMADQIERMEVKIENHQKQEKIN